MCFLYYAFNNGLFYLGAELSDRAEILPPCGNRAGQVFHEVLNPTLAAAKCPLRNSILEAVSSVSGVA